MRGRGVGGLFAALVALGLFALAAVPAPAAWRETGCHAWHGHKRQCEHRGAHPGRPVYSGSFVTEVNPFTFSQAPMWSPNGRRVVFFKPVDGTQQVFTSRLDGSGQACVTCGQPGPNQVAQYRPQGDVILFHSWREKQAFKVGSPGFGGVGSEVYVTNADGSGHPVNLTQGGAAGEGDTTGEGEDNYHAYFSPDGQKLVWTHLDCNFVTQDGRCQMEILYADYVDDASGPHLENVKVARPENGHYYETQLWAPDGSGFLYTESIDNSLNLELFFYRLADGRITRLTHNPAWDEQATFTPDMKKVIFMSTRDHPGLFNSYRNLADALGVDASTDWATILPVFELGFLQPIAQESTDLYELDLATGAERRLTHSGDQGWIVPEFSFDPHSGRLLYTEARFPDGTRIQLPISPVQDIQEFVNYLATGDPLQPPEGGGNVGLDTILGLERRTIIGHYER